MSRNWVLLRGLIRESRHWEGFDVRMQAAFPGDHVVAIDLPGNGQLHDQASPTRIEGMVAGLRQQLSDRGLSPPFHVLALSLGAMTTLSWMDDYPSEVAAAALMNTSVARFSPFWRRLRYQNYGQILRALLAGSREKREAIILSITSNQLDSSQQRALAKKWADYAAQQPVSTANALRQLLSAARFQAPDSLPPGVPVLVLNGGGDRLVSPRCSRELADGWNLPLRVHPGGGHDLTLDQPDWVVDELRQWLGAP